MRNSLGIHEKWRGKTKYRTNLKTHIVGHGIWRTSVKNVKYKKYTLQDLEYGKKTDKQRK